MVIFIYFNSYHVNLYRNILSDSNFVLILFFSILGSRLCATTLIVYYEDKEIRLGIQRSCAAEDRDENIVDGACNTKTVKLTRNWALILNTVFDAS